MRPLFTARLSHSLKSPSHDGFHFRLRISLQRLEVASGHNHSLYFSQLKILYQKSLPHDFHCMTRYSIIYDYIMVAYAHTNKVVVAHAGVCGNAGSGMDRENQPSNCSI
jgi:hypothetical protein